MACTTCASECMCAVISGDTIISVTGVGSAAVPYTVTADICNGLQTITDAGRDVVSTDKAVVIDNGGACQLVTIPAACGIPDGGTAGQQLLKLSTTNCDVAWTTTPYVSANNASSSITPTVSTYTALPFNTDVVDPYNLHDPVTNNTDFVIPAGWGGWWSFGANAIFTGTADNFISMNVSVNGTMYVEQSDDIPVNTGQDYMIVNAETYLAAGDIVTFKVYWAGTGSVTVGEIKAWGSWRAP